MVRSLTRGCIPNDSLEFIMASTSFPFDLKRYARHKTDFKRLSNTFSLERGGEESVDFQLVN